MSKVQVTSIHKDFAGQPALNDISIDFDEGEFYGLLGPSGSGKTTLLRVIAGFIFADSGSVIIDGQSVEQVPVEKREIGMVFQNYALFPNMSVYDNIGFGLRVRRESSGTIEKKVKEALELVQLGALGQRRPHQLSGGQRQRVALARALVTRPRVLLLDEPLSALDKALRVDMQVELKRIQREVGITTIFVTHDQEEALTLSDRIGILRNGSLVQNGPPQVVYNAPISEFAACFLGDANIFQGETVATGLRLTDGTLISCEGNAALIQSNKCSVRPEHMKIYRNPAEVPTNATYNILQAQMVQRVFAGSMTTYLLHWQEQTIKVLAKGNELQGIPVSGEVTIAWPAEKSVPLAQG